jgi:hypothetical protein
LHLVEEWQLGKNLRWSGSFWTVGLTSNGQVLINVRLPVWSKNSISMKSKDDCGRGRGGPDGGVTPRYNEGEITS